MSAFLASASLVFALQAAGTAPTPGPCLALAGEEAESFLRTAEVVAVADFKTLGVTRPEKVELRDGGRTCHAVFKTVDEHALKKRFTDGRVELHFSDSFKYEIAAYELDRLVGLGVVPPTVERRIGRDRGSLCLWIEGAITEADRLETAGTHPPDLEAWNRQVATIRLFLALIHDTDYRNINNLLVTPGWKLYKIDSSRAFRTDARLLQEESLRRFSRAVLASLESLERSELDRRLGRWLDARQLDGLWARRNLLLELAARRVASGGEEAVLFD